MAETEVKTTKKKTTTKKAEAPVVEEKVNAAPAGPSTEDLIAIIQGLSREIEELKKGKDSTPAPTASTVGLEDILAKLSDRKSDREVTIVHNFQNFSGLVTPIRLSNLSIDFAGVGEQRILSWQQFEECVSKYRKLFDKRIILLAAEHADIAEKYNITCVDEGFKVLTNKDLSNLNKLSLNALEEYVNSLRPEDKETVYSYWLGKCYTKEAGYYDRAKVELLNRLSGDRMENMLAYMNGDYLREEKK